MSPSCLSISTLVAILLIYLSLEAILFIYLYIGRHLASLTINVAILFIYSSMVAILFIYLSFIGIHLDNISIYYQRVFLTIYPSICLSKCVIIYLWNITKHTKLRGSRKNILKPPKIEVVWIFPPILKKKTKVTYLFLLFTG